MNRLHAVFRRREKVIQIRNGKKQGRKGTGEAMKRKRRGKRKGDDERWASNKKNARARVHTLLKICDLTRGRGKKKSKERKEGKKSLGRNNAHTQEHEHTNTQRDRDR